MHGTPLGPIPPSPLPTDQLRFAMPPMHESVEDERRRSQGAARGRAADIRAARIRGRGLRTHHRARPRVQRLLLGQPVRDAVPARHRQRPRPRQLRGPGDRGPLPRQPGGVHRALPGPRRPPRRRRGRPLPLGARAGPRGARRPARPDHPGELRLLRGPRALRRLLRRRRRRHGGLAASPPRSTATRRSSCATTACSPSATPWTRRPGGSCPWNGPARSS